MTSDRVLILQYANRCRSCKKEWSDHAGTHAVLDACPGCRGLYWTSRLLVTPAGIKIWLRLKREKVTPTW